MKIVAKEKLLETIGDDAEIVSVHENGTTAVCRWPDGSQCLMHWNSNVMDWCFPNDNVAYEAGYAYACGYRD